MMLQDSVLLEHILKLVTVCPIVFYHYPVDFNSKRVYYYNNNYYLPFHLFVVNMIELLINYLVMPKYLHKY